MKALVLYGPNNFKCENNWLKPRLKEGWVIVKIKYSGICGSDLPRMMITGSYNHPKICGHEFMGYIDEPSPNSNKFNRGDKVAILPLIPCMKCSACLEQNFFHCNSYNFLGSRADGGFAEYCLVPEENIFLLPRNSDDRIGAFIEPISVALHTIRLSKFKGGTKNLVFGAGAIGILIAMWLRILGAKEITIVSRSENSLQTARNAGFNNVIGINDKRFEEIGNFDYSYDAAGSNDALIQAINKTKPLGMISVIGRETKDINIPLSSFERFMRKELSLKGCWGYVPLEKDFIFDVLDKKQIDISKLISREADLSEGESLIRKMFNKEEYFCKVLFKIGEKR